MTEAKQKDSVQVVSYSEHWDIKQYMAISKIYEQWTRLIDKDTLFYVPIIKQTHNDKEIKRPYMEAPPNKKEPWIVGIVSAFFTQDELFRFIKHQCQSCELSIDDFTYWKTSLAALHELVLSLKDKHQSSVLFRMRINVYEIDDDDIMQYVDTIYDPATT